VPRGNLFVISAPSGTGKTTIVERLVRAVPNLRMSLSYTSRDQRSGECDGQDYHFVSRDCFNEMVSSDGFLEWADVFGNLYGTSRADTEDALSSGVDLVMVIDVQGAAQIQRLNYDACFIFVLPPSYKALEGRLRGRSRDDDKDVRLRLEVARNEIMASRDYDYVVVNEDLDNCVDRIRAIVLAVRSRQHLDDPIDNLNILKIIKDFEESAKELDRDYQSVRDGSCGVKN